MAASLAWACNPQAYLEPNRPASGPAGTTTTVTGRGFHNGAVEIRWGSETGPLLATVEGPSFSVPVRVPDASPGVYSIVAIAYNPTRTVAGKGAAPFEITGTGSGGGPPPGGGAGNVVSGTTNAGEAPQGSPDAQAPSPGASSPSAASAAGPALAAEAHRGRDLRRCLARAKQRARRASSRRTGSARQRARAKRRAQQACLKRHGRKPGRVTGLQARALSNTKITLSFNAPGTDGSRPPAARRYLIKQSLSPIRDAASFARAPTLCNGSCRFSLTEVGAKLTLTITDLSPNTTYYYAIAARDNVSPRLGARSTTVSTRTSRTMPPAGVLGQEQAARWALSPGPAIDQPASANPW